MSVENIIKSRKRYASNIMWMTALLCYIWIKSEAIDKIKIDKIIKDNWLFHFENYFKKHEIKTYLKVTLDPELLGFRSIAYDKTVTNYNADNIDRQIDFEINCLPAETKALANFMIGKEQWKPPLREILKVMYLTRIAVAVAERICLDDGVNKVVPAATSLKYAKLFAFCTRIRSSTFSTMAPDYKIDEKDPNKSAKEMKEFYKNWGDKADAPFHGNRRYRDEDAIHLHRDDPILTSWAGTHKRPVDSEKSVLGMVERVYNLPERCDISGTTTDTLGYALFDWGGSGFEMDKILNPDIFTFINIYGMILSGHHSLFETHTGASLWSKECYFPFDPLSSIEVLSRLLEYDGTIYIGLSLEKRYNELRAIVNKGQGADDLENAVHGLYLYTIKLWHDLAGINVPGTKDKTDYWWRGLEITQTVYVMAEKLCSVAHGLKFG